MASAAGSSVIPFSALLDALRGRGLAFDLHDYNRLARLVDRYRGNSPHELREAIAALLGRDTRDQFLIREVFDELFGVLIASDTDAAEPVTPQPSEAPKPRSWSSAAWRLIWGAAALLVSGILVAAWLITRPPALPPLPPPPTGFITPELPPVVDFGPVMPPTSPPVVPSVEIREWGQVIALAAAIAIVLTICGGALRSHSLVHRDRRRQWRSILAGLPGPQSYRLDAEPSSAVVPRHVVDEVATVLTRRRERPLNGRALDVRESVRRTLRAGLWPHVVFMPACRILPTVVLQDIGHEMRPWRARVDRFLSDLERQGVPLDRFFFDASAARVSRSPFGATEPLESLAKAVDDAALLVIGTGAGVIEALSEPADRSWLTTLRRWPRRSWLTPLENLAHGRPELLLLPLQVWPMTDAGLHAMAAALAEQDPRPQNPELQAAVGSRRVNADDVERVKRLVAMAPAPVSLELVEQLRMRFCPDVPRDVIVHLLAESEGMSADAIVLNDLERSRLVAAQIRDSVARAIVVQEFLRTLLGRSEPRVGTAAHLRWQADRALLSAQLDDLRGREPGAAFDTLRTLASGPLGDELKPRLAAVPSGARLKQRMTALSQAAASPLPGGRRRLPLAWPAPGHLIAAALGGLATAATLLATESIPVRAVEHMRDAFDLEWTPDPSSAILGDVASRGQLRMSLPSALVDGVNLERLPVRVYRDGGAVGEAFNLTVGSLAERFLENDDLGHWYQLRAELEAGRFALSNDVWVPGQAPPGRPLRVVVDAAPWARVRVFDLSTRRPIDAPDLMTPFAIELPEGDYLLEFENGGLTPPTRQAIAVRTGSPNTFHVVMPGFDVEQLMTGSLPTGR